MYVRNFVRSERHKVVKISSRTLIIISVKAKKRKCKYLSSPDSREIKIVDVGYLAVAVAVKAVIGRPG